VEYHDPFVPHFAGRDSRDLNELRPEEYDLCVVVTDHGLVESRRLLEAGWRLLDTTGGTSTAVAPLPGTRGREWLDGVMRLFRPRPVAEVAS
jgi:hypothetical protein